MKKIVYLILLSLCLHMLSYADAGVPIISIKKSGNTLIKTETNGYIITQFESNKTYCDLWRWKVGDYVTKSGLKLINTTQGYYCILDAYF